MPEKKTDTPSLIQRAEGDLQLIRSMMQRSSRFVPLPGWGIAMIGVIGSIAGWLAGSPQDGGWVLTWLVAALLSITVALVTSTWQLKRSGRSTLTGSHLRFWLSLFPAFLAAAVLTLVFVRLGQYQLLAGLWLLLYGVGVVAAGEQTVAPIIWMGRAFTILGAVALFLPWPNLFMGLGFGGLHLWFGLMIMRSRYE